MLNWLNCIYYLAQKGFSFVKSERAKIQELFNAFTAIEDLEAILNDFAFKERINGFVLFTETWVIVILSGGGNSRTKDIENRQVTVNNGTKKTVRTVNRFL